MARHNRNKKSRASSPKIASLKLNTHRGHGRKNASLNDLRISSHKGRGTKTGKQSFSMINHPGGVRASALKADPRLIAPAMTKISPTPNGPEPGHGGNMF